MQIIQPTISQGSSSIPTGAHKVTFIDYDGTILKDTWSYSGGTVIAPALPILSNLTFQAWNNDLTNIQNDLVIGAIRKTTDNKTHINMTLNSVLGLSPTIYLYKVDGSIMTVDWGDGHTSTTGAVGNISVSNTYAASGDKSVTITCTGNYYLGQGGETTKLFSGSYNQGITSIYLSQYVTKINTYALKNAFTLKKINIPNSISVEAQAFFGCNDLQGIVFSSGVTVLNQSVLNNCYSLKNVSLYRTTSSIGDSAFVNCYNLINLNIPDSVTNFGASAFNNCKKYNLIKNFPDYYSDNSIDISTFRSTNIMGSLTIPESVKTIGNTAFQYCYYIDNIYMVSGLTSIGSNVFEYDTSLKIVDIPNTITSIGDLAFNQCYNLTDIYVRATTPPTIISTTFSNISPLCKIHVPIASETAYKTALNWTNYSNYIIGDL